jgi:hypothetical protein
LAAMLLACTLPMRPAPSNPTLIMKMLQGEK